MSFLATEIESILFSGLDIFLGFFSNVILISVKLNLNFSARLILSALFESHKYEQIEFYFEL